MAKQNKSDKPIETIKLVTEIVKLITSIIQTGIIAYLISKAGG